MNQQRSPHSNWSPDSWRRFPALQQPVYGDPVELESVLKRLRRLPPLVTSWEIEDLKAGLVAVSKGHAFLLQAGDCSESLEDCETRAIVRNLKVLIQFSFVLIHGSMKRVIRLGRMAGQYAKPRTDDTETRDGVTLPVYRGDNVNRSGFTESDRRPDPNLLMRGYERAAMTLNFVRSLVGGGFADLHHPEYWELDFPTDSQRARDYREMVQSITRSMQFMEAVQGANFRDSHGVTVYTSHEGLHLGYEESQTRSVPRREGYYNLGTHLPWIGMRTSQIDGAHVEYFRGIRNPVGVKVGPGLRPEELIALVSRLNPENEPGRLTLIHRFGSAGIREGLLPLIEVVQRNRLNVVWSCDPMHGNTFVASNGIKTRRFDDVFAELVGAFDVHAGMGSILGGVHLELTGDNVTECVGGSSQVGEVDLTRAYKSAVDPRLNYDQAMELAFLIAERMQNNREK